MLHALTVDRLEKALRDGGCPACAEMDRSTRRYLRGLLRDHKTNPAVWGRLKQTWGLCHLHTGGLLLEELQTMSGFSTATLYRWLAEALIERVGWTPSTPSTKSKLGVEALRRLLKPDGICLACEQLGDHERAVVQGLVQTLAGGIPPGIREAYLRGDGLCLPHLRLALTGVTDSEIGRMLGGHFLYRVSEIATDLDRYREACAEEGRPPKGPEPPVWRRAMEQFAGRLGT